jgi:hypothetical protein
MHPIAEALVVVGVEEEGERHAHAEPQQVVASVS